MTQPSSQGTDSFEQPFASQEIRFISATGVERTGRLSVGPISTRGDGTYVCRMLVSPVRDFFVEIVGASALQSLTLAISFMRSSLRDFESSGGKMYPIADARGLSYNDLFPSSNS